MPCFRPLNGFRSRIVNPSTGKRSIVWSPREAEFPDHGRGPESLVIPCGQCRFCRLEHSRQWAIRCMHEASLYQKNCFLTLTYSDEFLPPGGSLDYDAPVLFMKRLRKRFGADIRSYGCAEYGELFQRPHYHLCVFNFDFSDKKLWRKNGENSLYISEELQKLWAFGHTTVGSLTFESAAYVARYVTKKITGARASKHYEQIDEATGEVRERLPERAICVSRRPGIGRRWIDENSKFSRVHDFVVLRGKKVRPPKYYDRLFDVADPKAFAIVKARRKEAGINSAKILQDEDRRNFSGCSISSSDVLPKHRLTVIEEVQELKFKQLKRGFEDV